MLRQNALRDLDFLVVDVEPSRDNAGSDEQQAHGGNPREAAKGRASAGAPSFADGLDLQAS